MGSDRIAIMIAYKDRPTELALLLESLWHQTYRNFDIFISDDCSGTPINNYHFLVCLFNKMNDVGNYVRYRRNEFNYGVSKNRQKLVDWVLSEGDYPLMARVDDDVLLEPNYIEKLLSVINQGYDLSSGVTPFIGQPQFKRESKHLNGIGNRVILNEKGEFIYNGDSCGMEYLDEAILPIHHFRSCALYKKEIHEKVNYDSRLTKHGFREEEILSFKCIVNGFKLGMNTKAIAWHLLTPSGGERFAESQEMVKINEEVLKEFTKKLFIEKGNFIEEYNKKLNIIIKPIHPEELLKQTNLIIK